MRLITFILSLTIIMNLGFSETELLEQRGFMTKTYQVYQDSSKFRTVFSSVPLHYIDENDQFAEIPTSGAARDSLLTLALSQISSRNEETWTHWEIPYIGRYTKIVDGTTITYNEDSFYGCWVGQYSGDLGSYNDYAVSRGIVDLTGITVPWADITEVDYFESLTTSFQIDDYYDGEFGEVKVGQKNNFVLDFFPDAADWNGIYSSTQVDTFDPDDVSNYGRISNYYEDTGNMCYMFSRYLLGITDSYTITFKRVDDNNYNHASEYPIGEEHAININNLEFSLVYYMEDEEIDAYVTNRELDGLNNIGGQFRFKEYGTSGWSGWLTSGSGITVFPDAYYDFQTKRGNITYQTQPHHFKNWNSVNTENNLITYWEDFSETDNYQNAYFKEVHSVNLTWDHGLLEILDPWLTEYQTDFDINPPAGWQQVIGGEYNVFLNEEASSLRYSVQAHKVYEYGNQYYEFIEWDGTGYTLYTYSGELTVDTDEYEVVDVKFTDSSAEIEALYNACGDGDVDGVGGTDVLDIVAIVSYIIGTSTPTSSQEEIADMNCNDEVDVLDVLIIIDFILDERSNYSEGDIMFTSTIESVNQDSSLLVIRLANEAIVDGIQLEINASSFGYNIIGIESGGFVSDMAFSSNVANDSSQAKIVIYDTEGDSLGALSYGTVANIWLTEDGTTSTPDSTDYTEQLFANRKDHATQLEHEYGTFTEFKSFVCDMESTFCYGCTDSTALNYNPVVTYDDSSCVYLLGDLNADGVLNVNDLVIMNNIILGNITPTPYQEFAGDMDGDGDIDVADVVILQNIILNQKSISRDSGEGEILISKVLNPFGILNGEDASLTINLFNEPILQAMLVTVDLEDNYEVTSVNLGERALNMDIQYRIFAENTKLSFVLFSTSGYSIEEGVGSILEIGLQSINLGREKSPDDCEFDQIQIANLEAELQDYEIVQSDDMERIIKTGKTLSDIPDAFVLHQPYPNPFNPVTQIRYDLPTSCEVSLRIYNAMGQEVVDLVDGYTELGYHQLTWNASSFASGVYFVKLVTTEFTQSQKVLLLK